MRGGRRPDAATRATPCGGARIPTIGIGETIAVRHTSPQPGHTVITETESLRKKDT